jgi:hypothetical protein
MASNFPRATTGKESEVEVEGSAAELDDDDEDASGERQSISPHSSRSCGEPRPQAGGGFDAWQETARCRR